jgi:hypothetical protein
MKKPCSTERQPDATAIRTHLAVGVHHDGQPARGRPHGADSSGRSNCGFVAEPVRLFAGVHDLDVVGLLAVLPDTLR